MLLFIITSNILSHHGSVPQDCNVTIEVMLHNICEIA